MTVIDIHGDPNAYMPYFGIELHKILVWKHTVCMIFTPRKIVSDVGLKTQKMTREIRKMHLVLGHVPVDDDLDFLDSLNGGQQFQRKSCTINLG